MHAHVGEHVGMLLLNQLQDNVDGVLALADKYAMAGAH